MDLLLQADVSKELICPKDFASDKKVEQLFSYDTLHKVAHSVDNGEATGYRSDFACLLVTFLFSKLHLHAVNAKNVPAKHRAYYLCITFLYFLSIDGINIITKRNMILESIANIFLCMRSDISKVRHCTSEISEHMFGNIRQEYREFTCSEFSNITDKQNRRLRLAFAGDLKVSDDEAKGYQESLAEFLQSASIEESYQGPCTIDFSSDIPISEQLWPSVKKILHKSIDDLQPLLSTFQIHSQQKSVLFGKAETMRQLMEQIITYGPKSFSYDDLTGEAIEDTNIEAEVNDSDNNNNEQDYVIRNIKNYATDILSIEREPSELNDTILLPNDASNDNKKRSASNDLNEIKTKKQKLDESRASKMNMLVEKNKTIMTIILKILSSNNESDIILHVLEVSQLLDRIERGSISMNTKYNSLLGRWFKKEKNIKNEVKIIKDLLVERDRIITCYAEYATFAEGRKTKTKVRKFCRVLSVFKKTYNKWFMTSEKQKWSDDMKKEDLLKYRCAIRMIDDGSVDDYEDVDLFHPNFELQSVCRIITGADILSLHNDLFNY